MVLKQSPAIDIALIFLSTPFALDRRRPDGAFWAVTPDHRDVLQLAASSQWLALSG